MLDYSQTGPFYVHTERIGVASATPVSPFGLTQTNIFLQQCAEAQAASQRALRELRQFMDTLAKAKLPGFNPGSCNEPDVKSTSTVTVTSCHTTRLDLRPSCHPRSSEGEFPPPDVSLTLPMSSSPPPTPVPPPCIDPHLKPIQEERFTPQKAMPSKLMVVHSTTVNSRFGATRPAKRDWMDRVAVQ
ncbi:hypothetical protein BT96DRAFT_1005938 [Gymnopus androsaceus JB14]|uniref:Uncharacterized protein n=1 Tax=Gymnopus androsaceus JB14 TaxID=1447944 RepID=A0A6A4GLE7_9AGAR|nr:hypothetical protein BT96DRAFT_1005938 [Gymnopus androsaceus JB14]